MLVLTRHAKEAIDIDGGIRVTVVEILGNKVRLGFEAPKHIGIRRDDIIKIPEPGGAQPKTDSAE